MRTPPSAAAAPSFSRRRLAAVVAMLPLAAVAPSLSRRRLAAAVAMPLALVLLMLPCSAEAHGPVAPVATSYLARVTSLPSGLQAKVVDGYVRMWLKAPASETVEVLDYRGAPYLRFTRAGVYVNRNSEMYYLNYIVPLEPPGSDTAHTLPRWQKLTSSHEYGWHDGRIGGLTELAVLPGTTYLGRWTIPIRVDGRLATISGKIWRAGKPSLVWFWPIVVLLACFLAAWRLQRHELDTRIARAIAGVAMVAIAVGAFGQALHGRPGIAVEQIVLLAAVLAWVCWAFARVLRRRHGLILLLATSLLALLIGVDLAPTLTHGFVLIALPAFFARVAAVICIASSPMLFLLVLRMADWAP